MNKKGKIKKGSLKLDYGLLNIYKMRIHIVLFILKCMIIIPTKKDNYIPIHFGSFHEPTMCSIHDDPYIRNIQKVPNTEIIN